MDIASFSSGPGILWLNVLAASLLVGSLGLLAALLAHRKSLPLQQGLLFVALALTIFSPALSWLATSRGLGLIAIRSSTTASEPNPTPNNNATASAPIDKAISNTPLVTPPIVRSTSEAQSPPSNNPLDPAPAPSPTPSRTSAPISPGNVNFGVWIAAIWATGALVLLLRFVRAFLVLAHLRKSLKAATHPRLTGAAKQAFAAMGWPLAPTIYESPLAPSPLTIGFWNCAIVVPQGVVESLDDDQLVSVLAHEAAHITRRDTLLALFQQTAAIALWWNPLVRAINARINLIREQICDDLVVKHFGDGVPLARAIVKVAEWSSTRTAPIPLVASLMSGLESIEKRIDRLAQPNRTIALGWSYRSRIAIGGLSLLLLAVALVPVARTQVLAATPNQPPANQKAEWKIRIQVLDENGKPIANTQIGTVQDQEKYDAPDWYDADDQGSYTLTVPDQRPKYLYILARAEGYTPARAFWWNLKDRVEEVLPAEFTFELPKAITVGGIVVDEEGKPIEGAAVKFSADVQQAHSAKRTQVGVRGTYVTDKQGKWMCELAPPKFNTASISVSHADFASDSNGYSIEEEHLEELRNLEHPFTLKKGFSLSGRIADEKGNAVAGAAIVLCELNIQSGVPIQKTDLDGRFRFDKLAPRSDTTVDDRLAMTISVLKPGYMPIQERVPGFGQRPLSPDSTEKDRTVNLTMRPGYTLSLRVVDAQGNPIKKAWVNPMNWNDTIALQQLRDFGIPQETDENGIWSWTDAPPGGVIGFAIVSAGFARVQNHLVTVKSNSQEEEIVMRRPQIIVGKVTHATTKEPIKEFKVERAFEGVAGHPDGLSWNSDGVRGKDGKYKMTITMPPSRTGGYTYRILAEGYEPAISKSISYAEGEVTIDFELKPIPLKESSSASPKATPAPEKKEWKIRVRTVDVAGRPIANPRIGTINGSPEAAPQWHQGDREGWCTLALPDRLPKFLYLLARADGFASMQAYWWNQTGAPEDALPTEFTFEMEKGTTVGGVIVDEQGKPVAGAAVKFFAPGNEANPGRRAKQITDETYVTDSEGKWRCDTAPQKITTPRIVVSHPEFAADSSGYSLDAKVKELRDQTLTLALKKGFNIRGRVVDEKGEPITGATLTFSPTGMFSHVPFQKTDADGGYRFDNVTYLYDFPDDGRGMLIGVVKQGYAPLLERFQPADKRADKNAKENELLVNMTMKRGVELSFRVVDTQNKPLKNAWVLPLIWQQTQVLMELRDHGIPQRTDENGVWTWKDFPSGKKMMFAIQMPEFAFVATPDITVTDDGKTETFVMKRAQIVVGTVTNAKTMEPIKEFSLERTEPGAITRPTTRWVSDGIRGIDGKYRGGIAYPPANGKYVHRVLADGFEPAESDAIPYTEGEVTINFELYPKAPRN